MKLKAILVTLGLALALTGCGASPDSVSPSGSEQASNPQPQAKETTPDATEESTTNEMPALVNQHEENDDPFYTYRADYVLIDNPDANMTYNNINEAIQKEIKAKNTSLYAQAQSAFLSASDEEKNAFTAYALESSGQSVFINTHVISYSIHFSYQTGQADTFDETLYLNYDLNSGQSLTLDQLVDKSELEDQIIKATDDQFEVTADLSTLSFDQFYFNDASQLTLVISPYLLTHEQTSSVSIPLAINSDTFTSPVIGTSVKANTISSVTDTYDLSISYPIFTNTEGPYPSIDDTIEADVLAFQAESIEMAEQDHGETDTNANFYLRPYQYSADYTIYTNTNKVLSLGILYYQYTGGAHGMNWEVFYNYDIKTGQALSLADLFEKGFDYQTYINDQIYQKLSEDDPYNVFTFNGISAEQAFYIEGNELVIYFSPYEIAPFAAGAPTFRIPLPE